MNKFRVMLVAGILAAGLMGMPLVFAQENETPEKTPRLSVHIEKNGHIQLFGKATAVASTTITVASWGGAWTVDTADAKIIGNPEAGKPVMIQGQASESGLSVKAKIVRGEPIKKAADDERREKNGHEKKRVKIAEFVSEHGSTTIAELKPGILQKIFRFFKADKSD